MTNLNSLEKYLVRDDGSFDPPASLEIPTASGAIYPCGENGDLAVWTDSIRIAQKIASLGFKAIRNGEEMVFRFPFSQLDSVASIAGAKKSAKGAA